MVAINRSTYPDNLKIKYGLFEAYMKVAVSCNYPDIFEDKVDYNRKYFGLRKE
jgi:hypothetical protein